MLYQLLDLVRTSVCANYSECTMRCHDKLEHIRVSPNHQHKKCAVYTKFHTQCTSRKHQTWTACVISDTFLEISNPKSSKYNVQPHTAQKPAVVSGHEELAKFAILKHKVSICRPPEPPPWLWLGWIFILSAGQSQLHALYPFSATKEIMCHRDAHIIQNLV